MRNLILFVLFLLFSFSVQAQTYSSGCKCSDEVIVQDVNYIIKPSDTFVFRSLDIIDNSKVLLFNVYRNDYILPYQVQVTVQYKDKKTLDYYNKD